MFDGDDLRSSYTRLRSSLQQMSSTEIHGIFSGSGTSHTFVDVQVTRLQ